MSETEAIYSNQRRSHWDDVHVKMPNGSKIGSTYRRRLLEIYRHIIPPGNRVLELGCGQGTLLASLEPSLGVGVDFSAEALDMARKRHPELTFLESDVHDLSGLQDSFDFILLSDVANDLWDVQKVFSEMRRLCTPQTRIVLNVYSHLWEVLLNAVSSSGIGTPRLEQNWLTEADLENLLLLSGFETVRTWQEVLLPLPLPVLSCLANRYLVKLPGLRKLAFSSFIIARPRTHSDPAAGEPTVSVIVPARNEAGNVEDIFRRVPQMGGGTELIFVEGHSGDDTLGAIQRTMAAYPEKNCRLFRQTGKGKGDAVRLGFAEASGDIVMILDADLTVRPEDLPRFVDALRNGHGEFINGVRLVYPMEDEAMRFLNLLGNKFFSLAFSWLLGQRIKDTLCGTKVLWKRDYLKVAENRAYFGEFDPFGDFDLLFGAAKMGLKIVEMPIRYQARTYGTTNIQRWRHGVLLLRMVVFAARRIKFV